MHEFVSSRWTNSPADNSLFAKCKDWINDNIPKHTQTDWDKLLRRHKEIMTRLIEREIQYTELRSRHEELEEEIWNSRKHLAPPIQVSAEYCSDIRVMADSVQVTYAIRPYQQNISISRYDLHMFNGDLFPRIAEAFLSQFEKNYVPKLKEELMYSLSTAAKSQ